MQAYDHIQSQPLSRWDVKKYISKKGDTLNYRLLFPDYNTIRKYPLVVFLHGSGERGNDNISQLMWGAANFATDQAISHFPAFVIAPQCPANGEWANLDENEKTMEIRLKDSPTRTMELVIELIHEMTRTFSIDTNRIYITGLSMGGYGTFDAIMRYPNLFAAAAPVCGGGDVTKASSIAHIPVWIFHGAEDPGVNPQYSIDMADALFKAGAHPGLTIYPETGHFVWQAVYSDPMVMEWLFRQHK